MKPWLWLGYCGGSAFSKHFSAAAVPPGIASKCSKDQEIDRDWWRGALYMIDDGLGSLISIPIAKMALSPRGVGRDEGKILRAAGQFPGNWSVVSE